VSKDPIPDLIVGVDAAAMKRNLYYLAKDPLPFRKLNLTLPGHEKSTLDEADDYIAHKLESWGYAVEREPARVQAYRRDETKPLHAQYSPPCPDDPWYTAHNVYARRTGSRRPDQTIAVISHKDSQSWIDSPGANDNAIGTVGSMEVARLLSAYQPSRSLCFIYCNEEHTPWTSVTAAEGARKRGEDVLAVINMDGIGVRSVADREARRMTNVVAYTEPQGEPIADLYRQVIEQYGIALEHRKAQRTSPGDDDGSFVKAGFPAAVLVIGSFPYEDPNYHSPEDVADLVDVENAALAVQATVAAIVRLDSDGL